MLKTKAMMMVMTMNTPIRIPTQATATMSTKSSTPKTTKLQIKPLQSQKTKVIFPKESPNNQLKIPTAPPKNIQNHHLTVATQIIQNQINQPIILTKKIQQKKEDLKVSIILRNE